MKTRIERLIAWIEAGSPAAVAVSWAASIVFVSAILWGALVPSVRREAMSRARRITITTGMPSDASRTYKKKRPCGRFFLLRHLRLADLPHLSHHALGDDVLLDQFLDIGVLLFRRIEALIDFRQG